MGSTRQVLPNTGHDRSVYFELKGRGRPFGGFTGTETLSWKGDWQANPTIIDWDIGLQGDSTDNSPHLTVHRYFQ
ncbi:MAG: hypothetical protein R2788_01630 [Saprospiraceae bacterium]